jgi:dihydrolipoamide dehydrogenase
MRDLIIIGGGAGAVAAALRATQLGSKVTVIEEKDLGGVCTNRGCIPTKALLHSVLLYNSFQNAETFGIRVSGVSLDPEKLAKKKTDLVNYLRMGTSFLLKSKGIEVIKGKASFVDPHSVKVNGTTYGSKAFVVATGSKWSRPSLPGFEMEGVISSDQALDITIPHKSTVVFGGDPIDVEFALYFALIGSKVTIVEEASRILSSEDREISNRMAAALKDKGILIKKSCKLQSIQKQNGALRVILSSEAGEEAVQADIVLSSKRVVNLDGLDLEKGEVLSCSNGILVDDMLRTNQSHIYAIGDVTGQPMYSNRASAQGIAAAEIIHGMNRKFNPNVIPRAFYTAPEIGAVGITEKEAKEQGLKIRVGVIPYGMNSRAMILMDINGIIKLISDAKNGKILGVHIIGPNATELIGQAALAMHLNATDEDLSRAVFPHPSLSESLSEAAREALGRALYIPTR